MVVAGKRMVIPTKLMFTPEELVLNELWKEARAARRSVFISVVISTAAMAMSLICLPILCTNLQRVHTYIEGEQQFCRTRAVMLLKEAGKLHNVIKSMRSVTLSRYARAAHVPTRPRVPTTDEFGLPLEFNGNEIRQPLGFEFIPAHGMSSTEHTEMEFVPLEDDIRRQGVPTPPPFLIDNPPLGQCCTCQVGRQGPPGAPGPPGLNADAGAPGVPGATGENAPPGATAPPITCSDCPPAQPGTPGIRGPKGKQGPEGDPGADATGSVPGPIGPPGPPGDAGKSGTPGEKGPLGDTGKTVVGDALPGIPGISGPKGLPGPKGQPGAPGKTEGSGNSGERGPAGASGVPGKTGTAGNPGSKGAPGGKGDCSFCPAPRMQPGY